MNSTNPTRLWPALALALAGIAPASAEWQPVEDKMLTPWAAKVSPDAPWSEYPRPQLQRKEWTNLNGLWNYAVTDKDARHPGPWAGEILVPFCPESALSGVGRQVEPNEALWYERSLPGPKEGKRTLLHFEAVDYDTTVWVNGTEVGSHRGGHTPFSFDITDELLADGNLLRVRVHDATEGFQLHGKQKLDNGGIWYTRVTGIWQTVWLEQVPERFLRDLDFDCDIRAGSLDITPKLGGAPVDGERVEFRVYDGQRVVSETSWRGEGAARLKIADPKLWSPDSPHLYRVVASLKDGDRVIDEVASYTALREYGKAKDANGHWRLTLNGEPIFHWGPLDQGWWPDGLLTPPSDEAMLFDIEYLKACGFNMIRKHIKVEPRRYYYHCDRLGMMMWQDQVSMGFGPQTKPEGSNPRWTRMAPNPPEGRWPDDAHQQYLTEYRRMVDHLRDHPCIAVWVPFNEAWGQHRTMEVGKMAVDYDKTRAINIASGGNFWPVGDIADHHQYPHPGFPLDDKRFDDYVKVVGEFGGHGWPVEGHLWKKDNANWGYGGLPKTLDEWKQRFSRSIDILCSLRKRGIAGGVYTQTTDVEVEINGLLTYDRERKVEAEWVKQQSERLLATPDVVQVTVLLPTSEQEPQRWRYTHDKPADGWEQPGFDDSAWKTGDGGFGTRNTPNTRVRTVWNGSDIWIRREFQVRGELKGSPVLRIYHDEDAEVFLNGQLIARLQGYNGSYSEIPVQVDSAVDAPAAPLQPGRNTIAIHCRQTEGGQYIDAGISLETPK